MVLEDYLWKKGKSFHMWSRRLVCFLHFTISFYKAIYLIFCCIEEKCLWDIIGLILTISCLTLSYFSFFIPLFHFIYPYLCSSIFYVPLFLNVSLLLLSLLPYIYPRFSHGRYYLISGNCMYYYSHKSDVRPKGVIFLTGSIVERVCTYF